MRFVFLFILGSLIAKISNGQNEFLPSNQISLTSSIENERDNRLTVNKLRYSNKLNLYELKLSGFSRFNFTVAPELYLFLQKSGTRWSSELSGLGMSQSIGVNARADYRLIKAIAISLSGGYSQWRLIRNYKQNGLEKYDESISLARIPIQIGVKLYPYRGFYLMPEVGISLLSTRTETSGNHPAPTNVSSSTTPITYGGNLGYEFNTGIFLIDLGARYQILKVNNMTFGAIAPALSENVFFGSLRVGIGFSAFRR